MDNSFGPGLLGHFDFTLLFIDIVFHVIPAGFILSTTPFFLAKIKNGPRVVRAGRLLWLKLALAGALAAVQAANAVLWFQSPLDSALAEAASILSCVSAVCIGVILLANHAYFVRPLPFLGLFLTITLLLDIAATRAYFRRNGLGAIARLHIAVPVLKGLLILAEETSKRSLVIDAAVRETLGSEALAGFWSKSVLVFIGFKFSQPFLLQDVVNAVSAKTEMNGLRMSLIIATGIIYIGMAPDIHQISRSWFLYLLNQMSTSTRAILTTAIYHKSLRIDSDEAERQAAVTLADTDVAGIMQLMSLSYESWVSLVEVILGITILAFFVGAASIFALIPASLTSVFTIYVSKRMAFTRKRWIDHTESRIADTANILAQFKDIKMMGLAPSLAKRLQEKQVEESHLALADRRVVVSTFSASAVAETVTPVLVAAGTLFWTRASEPITASRFFTTLAVITMIAEPLASFLTALPYWTGAFASVTRIQKYLAQPELGDPRQILIQNQPQEPVSSATGVTQRKSARLRNRPSSQLPPVVVRFSMVSIDVGTTVASVLRDATFSLQRGRTAMFIGPVGCGKSTLLSAIAGQRKLSTGSIAVATKQIACCAQRPWIRNNTIRANILGANSYSASRYSQVVFTCALDADIQHLPLGDLTVCGSDGCKLSGGQKTRIAMARALYESSDIILLDDPFSSLDMETSSTIRIRLFSESNFLDSGRLTLIMTTSMQQHLVDADDVFRILENGRVCQVPREELDAPGLGPGPRVTPRVQRNVAIQASEETDDKEYQLPTVKPMTDGDPMDNLPETKFSDVSLWCYFAKPAGLGRVLVWGVYVVSAAILERMPCESNEYFLVVSLVLTFDLVIFVRIWLETDAQNRLYFIGFAAFGLINPLMNYVACYGYFSLINFSALEALHWRLADTNARATFDFLATEDAGSLLNRFSTDTTIIAHRLPLAIMPSAWGAMSVLIDIAVIAAGASYAAPIMPLLLLFLFIIQHFYLKSSRQLRVLQLDNAKLLVRQLAETSTGIEHIRSFHWQDFFVQEFYEILEKNQKPFYFLAVAQQWLLLVLDLFSAGAGMVMVSIALYQPQSASPNSIGLSFLTLISFSQTVSLFVRYFTNMEISFGAVARIRAFERQTPVEQDSHDGSDLPPCWPRQGRIDFNGVTAKYSSKGDDGVVTEHTALDQVTVVVEPGHTLGIIGRTGSGKTSLLLALLRLTQYSGSISIDGRDIKSVPLDILRTRITTITQAGLELRGTVRFNLNPFDPGCLPRNYILTSEMERGVLRRVGLWQHISSRGGLEAEMRNMKFSQGQRQLFQLARAMLHQQIMNSTVVLIDEGTWSMDEDTEAEMGNLVNQAFASCTKLVVTHKLGALVKANAVLVLQNGKASALKQDQGTGNWRQSPEP
ncbi:multidrug resistance-associated protein, putative [Cordyceps militaris CM01]|uniref:Multidrug resistance-associated protein, putative n=1 Tax=Cordyceps militaris (strain CM01) TaxID=983644 RepID=G3JEV7_CORMM|nr:multidrug resistance-associated protein, putative [Cordyceps militaris CM01]EGX93450.1 multidrug resistance-associated protein, putative [Cordyceps militaris CM01]